jgi:Ser/Thr protein kinase RdoA (MazF antagonist)
LLTAQQVKNMQRADILRICDREVLEKAARLFGTRKEDLRVFPDYEGAANLVYEYAIDGKLLILRLSFRPERSLDQIRAEVHFVTYLAEQGVRVSVPVASTKGELVETIQAEGIDFQVVSFVKGKGMRVPDNGYRYREGVPIEEYFQNWGHVLGQMHRATQQYQPINEQIRRPDWFELHQSQLSMVDCLPEDLQMAGRRIRSTLAELQSLPKGRDCYGLIHGDFNDGNFTVDYSNGDMTVFDFDDCCYFWFMYEIACSWEGGIGRVMFRSLQERKAFMDEYMEQVMAGYQRANVLSDDWLEKLPLFIRLIQIEEFLHYAQYLDDPDERVAAGLRYKIKCIEEEIPYMGFFDGIYSPQRPFSLQ